MNISNSYFIGNLTYSPDKDCWNCLYKVKILNSNYEEMKDIDVLVHFSGKGDVQYATGKNQHEIDEVFEEMKDTLGFQKNFELCKELIEEIRDMRKYPFPDFYEFEYDYENKVGKFRFEESLEGIHFTLNPGEGIYKIYIFYHQFAVNTEKAKVIEDPRVLFGEKQAEALNEMIKKKLKVRFFF